MALYGNATVHACTNNLDIWLTGKWDIAVGLVDTTICCWLSLRHITACSLCCLQQVMAVVGRDVSSMGLLSFVITVRQLVDVCDVSSKTVPCICFRYSSLQHVALLDDHVRVESCLSCLSSCRSMLTMTKYHMSYLSCPFKSHCTHCFQQ